MIITIIILSIVTLILGFVGGYYYVAYRNVERDNIILKMQVADMIRDKEIVTSITSDLSANLDVLSNQVDKFEADLMGTQSQSSTSNESAEG